MLKQDYITEFLNLEDVIVTDVKNNSDQLHVYLELPRREHICPCCGAQADRVHDYREQIIRNPIWQNHLSAPSQALLPLFLRQEIL